jgi:hypothetical protein
MGLKTNGALGIIGGILLLLSVLTSMVLATAMYGISVSDLLNPDLIGGDLFALIVSGIVINTISGLVLAVVGILLASGKGRMPFAISMIVFGLLGIVFAIASIGGIIGIIGGTLGIAGGYLSRKEIKRQQTPSPTSPVLTLSQ